MRKKSLDDVLAAGVRASIRCMNEPTTQFPAAAVPADPRAEYMVLFRTNGWDKDLSPEEMQAVLSRTMEWFDRLFEAGVIRAAQPLFEEGRMVSGPGGRLVADGPFAESKESVAGYMIVRALSLEEAVKIARAWPMLDCGGLAEVRPVAPECPSMQRARQRHAAHAAA